MLGLSCRVATTVSRSTRLSNGSGVYLKGNHAFTTSLRRRVKRGLAQGSTFPGMGKEKVVNRLWWKQPHEVQRRIREAEQKLKNPWKWGSKSPLSKSVDEALPPSAFLKSARLAGALDIEPEKAQDLLRHYHDLAVTRPNGWEEKLCQEYNITPSTMTMLGLILNRGTTVPQQVLAKLVMLSASALGDVNATMQLLGSAQRRGALDRDEYAAPLQHLEKVAESGENVQAMVLLGKILQTEGDEEGALEMFEKAAMGGSDSPADANGVSEALVRQGLILLGKANLEGAETAFRKAALDFDYAPAYYQLAKLQPEDSPTKEIYLLKSASSGVLEACHELGEQHLKKFTKLDDSKIAGEMAKEWLFLGASGGYGPSMISLALLNKDSGSLDAGLDWLKTAEAVPEVSEIAQRLRVEWLK